MDDWKNCVNKCFGLQKIQDMETYYEDYVSIYSAPIDNFYQAVREIISYSSNPPFLEENKFLGPTLFLNIISATENYLRQIMVGMLKLCPICRAEASNQSVCLGSVIWQGNSEIEKGAFENMSFADSSSIKKAIRNYLKITIQQRALSYAIFEEFDKLCQIRHAIVHSNCIIAGKNAIKLQIPIQQSEIKIKIGYA